MLNPNLFHENFYDKHVIDQVQYRNYLPNMLYVTHIQNQEVSGTPTNLLGHTHMIHLYLIKSNILTISSKIKVPSSQCLLESINAFAFPLETNSLDGMWQ